MLTNTGQYLNRKAWVPIRDLSCKQRSIALSRSNIERNVEQPRLHDRPFWKMACRNLEFAHERFKSWRQRGHEHLFNTLEQWFSWNFCDGISNSTLASNAQTDGISKKYPRCGDYSGYYYLSLSSTAWRMDNQRCWRCKQLQTFWVTLLVGAGRNCPQQCRRQRQ